MASLSIFKNKHGITLAELLIAGVLVSVVFLGVGNIHMTSLRFFNDVKSNQNQISAYIALEHIARDISLANRVEIASHPVGVLPGNQIKLRLDYCATTYKPLNYKVANCVDDPDGGTGTPAKVEDDFWVQYAVLKDGNDYKLYRTQTANGTGGGVPGNINNPNQVSELLSGLVIHNAEVPSDTALGALGRNIFYLETPVGAAYPQWVRIFLATKVGVSGRIVSANTRADLIPQTDFTQART